MNLPTYLPIHPPVESQTLARLHLVDDVQSPELDSWQDGSVAGILVTMNEGE